MQDEIYNEIKKLEKQGINPLPHEKFESLNYPCLGVRVETALPDGADLKPLQWTIEIVDKKGAAVNLSDWAVLEKPSGQKVLSFIAHMRIPKGIAVAKADIVGTSFADFCWLCGNEAVKADHVPETLTEMPPGVSYGDIGWRLPCRFADRLLGALDKANAFLLSGALEDALLYGLLQRNTEE